MTKAELNQIKQAIVLIHNKDHAPVPHSSGYYEGLNILTNLVKWEKIIEHFPVDQLGDLGCGY